MRDLKCYLRESLCLLYQDSERKYDSFFINWAVCTLRIKLHPKQSGCVPIWTYEPVESIAHLYGDEDRKSHCHGVRRLKHHAVDTREVGIVLFALQKMALEQNNMNSLPQLVNFWNVKQAVMK